MNQKCSECNQELKMSQYARLKKEGESAIRAEENLACRNHSCKNHEKDEDCLQNGCLD